METEASPGKPSLAVLKFAQSLDIAASLQALQQLCPEAYFERSTSSACGKTFHHGDIGYKCYDCGKDPTWCVRVRPRPRPRYYPLGALQREAFACACVLASLADFLVDSAAAWFAKTASTQATMRATIVRAGAAVVPQWWRS